MRVSTTPTPGKTAWLMACLAFTVLSTHAQTSGWTQSSFTYSIQTPWNLQQSDRYKYVSPVHYFWIYNGDACQYQGCSTGPRSEMRWQNNYTSGKHQFEGEVYVVSGTEGSDICQVFGGQTNSTAIMLKVTSANGGTIKRYDNEILATGVYSKWTKINIQHDADGNKLYVYINGVHKGTFSDRGDATHYFKCGVYNITGSRSESRWRNLKYWKNGPVGGVPTGNVTLYQGCSYGGYSGSFVAGNYTMTDLAARGISNDDVSSIKISTGYAVTLYADNNFSGASTTLTSDNSCLTGIGWNDRISSMRVTYSGSTLTMAEEVSSETTESAILTGSPNPAAGGKKINIKYIVEEASHVKITINNINGQEITTLVNEHKPAGSYSASWETATMPKGIYIAKMLRGRTVKTIKLALQE